jgi:plasmid stabilization system protein ParE
MYWTPSSSVTIPYTALESAALERLAEFPGSGRRVPEFERSDLREIIHQQFRIVNRVGADHVGILTVRHSLLRLDESDFAD